MKPKKMKEKTKKEVIWNLGDEPELKLQKIVVGDMTPVNSKEKDEAVKKY